MRQRQDPGNGRQDPKEEMAGAGWGVAALPALWGEYLGC